VQYRQGDVLLVAVQDVPAGAVPVPRRDGSVVLAEGEATGHLHAIADPNAELLALPAEEAEEVERRFLRIVGGTATLTHQEHDSIVLPRGLYRVIRQREYVPGPPPVPEAGPRPPRPRFRQVFD
jgi:hypothetical protein